jgi:hypothetical protein
VPPHPPTPKSGTLSREIPMSLFTISHPNGQVHPKMDFILFILTGK